MVVQARKPLKVLWRGYEAVGRLSKVSSEASALKALDLRGSWSSVGGHPEGSWQLPRFDLGDSPRAIKSASTE